VQPSQLEIKALDWKAYWGRRDRWWEPDQNFDFAVIFKTRLSENPRQ
jgi:hypothetical protein